eukprot:11171937-Lingulodinium_polyedra.AAC.1
MGSEGLSGGAPPVAFPRAKRRRYARMAGEGARHARRRACLGALANSVGALATEVGLAANGAVSAPGACEAGIEVIGLACPGDSD